MSKRMQMWQQRMKQQKIQIQIERQRRQNARAIHLLFCKSKLSTKR